MKESSSRKLILVQPQQSLNCNLSNLRTFLTSQNIDFIQVFGFEDPELKQIIYLDTRKEPITYIVIISNSCRYLKLPKTLYGSIRPNISLYFYPYENKTSLKIRSLTNFEEVVLAYQGKIKSNQILLKYIIKGKQSQIDQGGGYDRIVTLRSLSKVQSYLFLCEAAKNDFEEIRGIKDLIVRDRQGQKSFLVILPLEELEEFNKQISWFSKQQKINLQLAVLGYPEEEEVFSNPAVKIMSKNPVEIFDFLKRRKTKNISKIIQNFYFITLVGYGKSQRDDESEEEEKVKFFHPPPSLKTKMTEQINNRVFDSIIEKGRGLFLNKNAERENDEKLLNIKEVIEDLQTPIDIFRKKRLINEIQSESQSDIIQSQVAPQGQLDQIQEIEENQIIAIKQEVEVEVEVEVKKEVVNSRNSNPQAISEKSESNLLQNSYFREQQPQNEIKTEYNNYDRNKIGLMPEIIKKKPENLKSLNLLSKNKSQEEVMKNNKYFVNSHLFDPSRYDVTFDQNGRKMYILKKVFSDNSYKSQQKISTTESIKKQSDTQESERNLARPQANSEKRIRRKPVIYLQKQHYHLKSELKDRFSNKYRITFFNKLHEIIPEGIQKEDYIILHSKGNNIGESILNRLCVHIMLGSCERIPSGVINLKNLDQLESIL